MIVAETARVLLRLFTMDDLDAMADIMARPELMRYSYRGPQTREETQHMLRRFLQRYERDGTGPYALIYKPDHRLVGFCGLPVQPVEGRREVEVGYGLHPDYWGLGLATEAAQAVRDYAFHRLGITRLVSIITAENVPSIGVAERVGMTYERDIVFYGTKVRLYSMDLR